MQIFFYSQNRVVNEILERRFSCKKQETVNPRWDVDFVLSWQRALALSLMKITHVLTCYVIMVVIPL